MSIFGNDDNDDEYEYDSDSYSYNVDTANDNTDGFMNENNPYIQMKVSKSAIYNKKNQAMNDIVNQIVTFGKLKATAGGIVWEYNPQKGCYIPVQELEKLVVRCLTSANCISELSVKDIKDICMRLLWEPTIQVDADEFNNDDDLINTASGVYDIRTGEVSKHSPEKMFTYMVDANILQQEDVSCPVFEDFCKTSLAPLQLNDIEKVEKVVAEKRRLLLEMIGYALCDSNAGKCALFLKGMPDSGKSIMVNFISQFFSNELVSNIPLNHLSDRFNKAELYGKKLNVAGEIKGKKLSEIATFKSISGLDKIYAERKGQDPFFFTPRCKMVFAGNTLPGTSETDVTKAFVNRLVVLLFNHSIPKEQQDKRLLEKLIIEKDSIFTLAMKALENLYERNFEFSIPEESKNFLQSFAERENSLQAFLQDRCYMSENAKVHNVRLLAAYQSYCEKNGLDCHSKKVFYEMLSGISGITMKKLRIGDENRWGHKGLGLIEDKE